MAETMAVERLALARQAMEGEERRLRRAAEAEQLLKRREDARRAMEGRERQLERRAAENAARQAAAAKQAAAEKQAAEASRLARAAQSAVTAGRARAAEEAVAERARQERARSATQTVEKLKTAPLEMSPIRTFKTDLAEAAARGVTLTQTIIREQGKQPAGGEGKSGRRSWLGLGVLFFLLLGAAAAAYLYFFNTPPAPPDRGTSPPTEQSETEFLFSLIADEQINIPADELRREELILKLRQAANDGAPQVGRLAQITATKAGRPLDLPAWLKQLQNEFSETLARALGPKFFFGRYDGRDGVKTFLLLKINDFQSSFPTLRQHENELAELFTTLTGRRDLNQGRAAAAFTDDRRYNLETRRLIQNDQTLFLYTFLDPDTVALLEDDTTLVELLRRRDRSNR